MSPRLRRFLHLERARPETPDAQAGLSAPERFGGTSTPTPTPTSTATATATGSGAGSRFLRPDLRAPDVAPVDRAAQPFTRCARCETDHSVHAASCGNCGEPLDTPAQRAFNEKLWAERLRAREEEERALASSRAAREKAEAETARARREMAETLARETGRRERDRLDAESYQDGFGGDRWGRGAPWGWPGGGGWGWGGDGDPRPIGIRLLALITNPRWRIAVAVGALALAAIAGLVAFLTRSVVAIYAVIAVFVLLFAPRRRRGWWR